MLSSIFKWFRKGPDAGLEKTLGYRFNDPLLLEHALIHRSWISGKDMLRVESNERLEFLGDSVLNMLVTEYLYKRWIDQEEGDLSKKKSAVVSGKALADCARAIGLGDYIRLGKGEDRTGGRDKENILADAFEAVMGAVFLDGGIDPVRRILSVHHFERIDELLGGGTLTNYKSFLLEALQSRGMGTPDYQLQNSRGPEHSKQFRMDVLVEGKVAGQGRATSKKAAEQEAARHALQDLFGIYPEDERD